VAKLFNIIQPNKAYFGQKDAQQVAVIKKMTADLNIPLDIVVGKTFREPNGLAMSSRNVFLKDSERSETTIIYKSLCLAEQLFKKGEQNSKTIKNKMGKLIDTTSGQIDYISIADPQSFKEIVKIKNEALISLAVRFGKTRLIDNIYLKRGRAS
jgi:pantoate--beta-alanine ligase